MGSCLSRVSASKRSLKSPFSIPFGSRAARWRFNSIPPMPIMLLQGHAKRTMPQEKCRTISANPLRESLGASISHTGHLIHSIKTYTRKLGITHSSQIFYAITMLRPSLLSPHDRTSLFPGNNNSIHELNVSLASCRSSHRGWRKRSCRSRSSPRHEFRSFSFSKSSGLATPPMRMR